MNTKDVKTITVVVPSKGMTIPFQVTATTTFAELFNAAGCPDWYMLSRTRKGPAVAIANKRPIDVASDDGKIYLAPPTTAKQLDLPLHTQETSGSERTDTLSHSGCASDGINTSCGDHPNASRQDVVLDQKHYHALFRELTENETDEFVV